MGMSQAGEKKLVLKGEDLSFRLDSKFTGRETDTKSISRSGLENKNFNTVKAFVFTPHPAH